MQSGELPALHNGTTWVSRFRNIVDYLRQSSDGEWDLDRELDDSARADNTAYVKPPSTNLKTDPS